MQSIPSLIILDLAAAALMTVLASLSRRLGTALKIAPYYRFTHVAVVMVLIAALMNAVMSGTAALHGNPLMDVIAEALRLCAGIIAVASCLRYWKWLFSEYLKK